MNIFDDRKVKCFFIPVDEIKQKNYDLSISKYKEIEYEKHEIIKQKILELEEKIINTLQELEI